MPSGIIVESTHYIFWCEFFISHPKILHQNAT